MKSVIFFVLVLVFFTLSNFAQVSPHPVIESEIRDGTSIRMRSIELERVKREANTYHPIESTEDKSVRFVEIKEDFEKIQKLQSEIIKAYTTEKIINYEKISESAAEIIKKAERLDSNLFISKSEKQTKNNNEKNNNQGNVRDLIIELDRTIGSFVSNPIFTNPQIVSAKDNLKAQANLEKLIKLSLKLNLEAGKMSKDGK